jgi:hypothetical protein
MLKRIAYILLFLSVLQSVYSQTNTGKNVDLFSTVKHSTTGQGKVIIKQDTELQDFVNKYIEYRRKDNKVPGYRIRIFSDSGQPARQRANSERSKFVDKYPDINTYLDYEQPNFKVYVGDFRNRNDAFRVFMQIKKDFSRAFIVPMKISPPKL